MMTDRTCCRAPPVFLPCGVIVQYVENGVSNPGRSITPLSLLPALSVCLSVSLREGNFPFLCVKRSLSASLSVCLSVPPSLVSFPPSPLSLPHPPSHSSLRARKGMGLVWWKYVIPSTTLSVLVSLIVLCDLCLLSELHSVVAAMCLDGLKSSS